QKKNAQYCQEIQLSNNSNSNSLKSNTKIRSIEQSFSMLSYKISKVLKILMQVEEQNENGAILNIEKVIQQQMIIKNENQTHLQRKELDNIVRDTLNKTVLKQNLFLIFQSQSQEKIREMEILIMRKIFKVLRKFKEISMIEFDKGFLEDIHMNCLNYFLNTIMDITLKYDQILTTSENIYTALPSSHSAIFSLLKQFAEDIDNDLQLKFENQDFKYSQFYQEIVKLLMEKLQIQMQLGNKNLQVSELNQFIQKLAKKILLKQNNDQMIIENS
ncbi:hypothetical protein ABPG72_014034, partial [Tetrahymena utriculariae]